MLKRINRDEALDAIYQGRQVFLMMAASSYTKLYDLFSASGYLIEVGDDEENDERFPAEPEQWTESDDEEDEQSDEDDEEIAEDPEEEDETEDEPAENEDEPKEPSTRQKARHQSIINMYMAGRSIRYIAQEFEINPATVKYHLHKEGLV